MARFIIGLLMAAVIGVTLWAAVVIGPLLAVFALGFSSAVTLGLVFLYDMVRHHHATQD